MITYTFLQEYWWLLVSLLGGLLVMLLFVQGANSLIFRIGHDEAERSHIIAITGRKWELTFTTLVTFGGAFFASFPLFYSTSFGGAYWIWMLLLVSFVLQAVAYEYQGKPHNLLGANAYRAFLVANGFVGPFVLGAAVATFFTGSAFSVNHNAMADASGLASPVISQWDSAWHGLEALAQPWNWVLGFAVFFLARVLGALYLLNRNELPALAARLRRQVAIDAVPFVVCFVAFLGRVLTADGLSYEADTQQFVVEPLKYLHNLTALPVVAVVLLMGVLLVLAGMALPFVRKRADKGGIWCAGTGTVLTVLALLLTAGLNHTAYYPSLTSPQSSLCLANSCSSEFTLGVMAVVSLLIPFVLVYIAYAWWCLERK